MYFRDICFPTPSHFLLLAVQGVQKVPDTISESQENENINKNSEIF